jgi:hypothetical protein
MMWPYMLSGLACGSCIILYNSSPFYPDVKTYLQLIDEQESANPLFSILCSLICVSVLHIWVQAPASYLRFKAVESSHSISLPTLPFHPVLEQSSGDVGRFEALHRIFSTGAVLTAL